MILKLRRICFFFAHDKIGVYAEMGILSPVTDFIPMEELEPYMDMTIKAATYQDVVYQLPVYYETLLFMYNKRYMKEEEVRRLRRSFIPIWRRIQREAIMGLWSSIVRLITARGGFMVSGDIS